MNYTLPVSDGDAIGGLSLQKFGLHFVTRSLDPKDGRVIAERPLLGRPGDRLIDFVSAMHFGDILIGTPFDDAERVLGVTGLVMYWNRYLRRRIRKR